MGRESRIGRLLRAALSAALITSFALSATASAAPPKVLSTSVSHVGTTSAELQASVNPEGEKISYRFEYGTSACSAEPDPCTTNGELKGFSNTQGTKPELLTATLKGLAPGSTYHFRIIVKSVPATSEATGEDTTFATFRVPTGFGSCPNETFRVNSPSSILPDCRAYEQTSSPNKNGADINGSPNEVEASTDGDALAFFTASGLPGSVGAQDFETFLAQRKGGNWSTRGVYPPAADGPVARNAGWTPDLSLFFSNVADSFNGPWLFQSRDSESEAFTHVAEGGEDFLAGASADGSLVYFQNSAQLLPAATPGKDNLYVWDRDTKTLKLAGILPGPECENPSCVPVGGSFAGAYEWFLGGGGHVSVRGFEYYVQPFHAISKDGSRAYFTAEGGQLYLREDAAGPSPKSVHVSAPQRSTPDTNGTRPAAFMAATPDGSKAFFTSAEKLTEDATTGPEPPPATIAQADLEGNGKNLEFLQAHANAVASDGEFLYWAEEKEGTIGRAKLGASGPESPEPKFIEAAGSPHDLAIEGELLFWTNTTGEGSIGRAKVGTGPATEANAEFIKGAAVKGPLGITADSEFVYWANGGVGSGATAGAVGRAKLDGSEAELELVPGQASGDVAVGPSELYRSRSTTTNGFIFFSNRDGSEDSALKAEFILIPGAQEAPDLAVTGSHLYWTNPTTGAIGRVPLEALGKPNLAGVEEGLITGAGHPAGLAADSAHLYWAANQNALPNPGNDLYQFDAETGDLSDLAVDTKDTDGAEVKGVLGTSTDGSYLYFAANGDLDGSGPAVAGNCRAAASGSSTLNGSGNCSLYLAHAGQVSFIAPLKAGGGESDATDWEPQGQLTERAAAENTARVSADGKTLLFRSQEKLTEYNNRGVAALYRFNTEEGLSCVSCSPSGVAPVGPPNVQSIEPALSVVKPPGKPAILTRNLSADGKRVFFETPDKLVAEDTDGEESCPLTGQASVPTCQDVYEWEAKGSGSCASSEENGGCLYLLSSGTSAEPAFFADASESGKDVFIFTRSALVPQDQDTLQDAYDAHVEGGLASQNVVASPPCEEEACKPGASPPPPFQSPQTPRFEGPGNPKQKGCPKGKRKVTQKGKSRCVAKKKHKDKSHKKGKKANKSGRAAR
jgi:sugar lactone lactonase YvrE